MPVRRTAAGWCSCFQSNEPPEITYKVVENGGLVNLQPLTPTQPMPDEEELNLKFAELVDELDLTAPNREAMFRLPSEKKWQLYCSKKKDEPDNNTSTNIPDHYIERVAAMSMLLFSRDEEEVANRAKVLSNLKTALRTKPNSYVLRFLEMDGLSCLLHFLSNMDYETAQSAIHTATIGCFKALMNNSNGRGHVLAHPNSINVIAQSLSSENIKTKIAVLEILGAICLVPGGHRKVLDAMLQYQKYACERTRFQTIVNDLDRSMGVYRDEVNLKTVVMSFINAMLKYDPGQFHLEFRIHLRYEFLMLGIQPVIDKLRSHENATLDFHLDLFEMVRNEDEKKLASHYRDIRYDTKSITSMCEALRTKLSHTAAYPHLLSLFQHMLLLNVENRATPQHYLLIDRIVQQIVLQSDKQNNPDVAPIEINVEKIVELLATEEELKAARDKAETFERENSDLITKLEKKEQEYDVKVQEKEDIEMDLNKTRSKLEKESVGHLEAKQKIAELECRITEVSMQLENEKVERLRLDQLVQGGSLPDDAKVGLQSVASNMKIAENRAPPPPMLPAFNGVKVGGPPPPPPPGPPPPPPPGIPQPPTQKFPMPGFNKTSTLPKKDIPISRMPLKCFNWAKLPDSKLDGTVWTELDDAKLYDKMDLEDFDRTFSAYQKQQNDVNFGDAMKQQHQGKDRIISVIDAQRATNCGILLKKLKMDVMDICQAILSMDKNDALPKDMIEQLLKFIPSSGERTLLEEHSEEKTQLTKADRFLFEVGHIDHYEQRLSTLCYKKTFNERIKDVRPQIVAILEASKELPRSKRIKKILEMVLAFGNYMNRGQRGNACGFKLVSLNRIRDTKSNGNSSMTLLHYLVETLETHNYSKAEFKKPYELGQDVQQVKKAAKVQIEELDREMKSLKAGLREVELELEYHRKQTATTGDQYVPVMKDFITTATYKFSELEELYLDMKTMFEKVVKRFGEDPNTVKPHEFFGIFDTFILMFNEAKRENAEFKKKKDAEEKRAKKESELKKKQQERKDNLPEDTKTVAPLLKNGTTNGYRAVNGNCSEKAGEFDDLISALRTGDVFNEDMAKLKRPRRRIGSANQSPTRNGVSPAREDSREREMGRMLRKIIA